MILQVAHPLSSCFNPNSDPTFESELSRGPLARSFVGAALRPQPRFVNCRFYFGLCSECVQLAPIVPHNAALEHGEVIDFAMARALTIASGARGREFESLPDAPEFFLPASKLRLLSSIIEIPLLQSRSHNAKASVWAYLASSDDVCHPNPLGAPDAPQAA